MSGGLVDKVYIGLDSAPASFDLKGRILGPVSIDRLSLISVFHIEIGTKLTSDSSFQNGTNLEYIRSETGVVAVLKVDKLEPLHLTLHHSRAESLSAARSLAQNLIETIRAELVQWSAAQAPPALNVPPPTLSTSSAPPPALPAPTPAVSTPPALASTPQPSMQPVVSVAQASSNLMTVRQPMQPLQQALLQLQMPQQYQQQYVLNHENGQLIPIVQQGMQVQNTNFNLPIAQQLGLQQPNYGTQMIDLSSMQPVNVTQLRLPSMILPNGLIPQASLSSADTTTVSSATSTPVVCAAPSTNSSHKILYSADKSDKEVKYHIQGAEAMQWTMPGSQTMLIPYQQLQDLAASHQASTNIQQQYLVSIFMLI